MTNLHVHMLFYIPFKGTRTYLKQLHLWASGEFPDSQNFFQTYIGLFKKTFLPFIPCLREPVIKFTQIWLMRQRKKDKERKTEEPKLTIKILQEQYLPLTPFRMEGIGFQHEFFSHWSLRLQYNPSLHEIYA